MQMKNFFFFLLIALSSHVYSQAEEKDKLFVGLQAGFSNSILESSNYFYVLGGSLVYYQQRNSYALSYIQKTPLVFNFGDSNKDEDKSIHHRLEASYQRTFRLAEKHKLFSKFYYTLSAGISYNSFKFYPNDRNWSRKILSNKTVVGIPLAFSYRRFFTSSFLFESHFKQNILYKLKPNFEGTFSLMVKIN